jgi:hypothetical protein
MLEYLKAFVYWLIGFNQDFTDGFVEQVWSWTPDSFQVALTPWVPYLEVVNYWVPVDDGFILLSIFLTFVCIFIAVKLFLKIFLGFFVS